MFWPWLLFGLLPSVHSFSFTTSTPTECDALKLEWSGGSPPFSLLLYPLFGSPRNISIPASAYDDGDDEGSFSFPLNIANTKQFILTMSDASGFATGGSTPVLTAGPSKGGSCNTTDPGVAFPFELNTALQQCRPYEFAGYTGAVQPVTIIGTVPGGTSFILTPPVGPTTFTWNANIAAGTSVIFSMFDSRGRNGGTSDLKTVGVTNDATCLNNQSPSSTASQPTTSTKSHATTTQRKPTSSSTSSTSATPTPAHGTSIAAIAGTVIGSLLFLAVLVTLGLFWLRKRHDRQKKNQSEVDLTYDPSRFGGAHPYPSVAAAASTTPLQYIPTGAPYESNPFLDSHSTTSPPQGLPNPYLNAAYSPASPYPPSAPYTDVTHYQQPPSQEPQSLSYQLQPQYQQPLPPPSQSGSTSTDADPFNPYNLHYPPPPEAVIQPFNVHNSDDAGSMTSTQRKAAMAGVSGYTPSRFILHTDADDELPPPNSEGVVELPPQYSERRAPPAQAEASASGSQQPPS